MMNRDSLSNFEDHDLLIELLERGSFEIDGRNEHSFNPPSLLHEEAILLFKQQYNNGNIIELINKLKNE